MPRKITQEEYLERCIAKHGSTYDLSLVEYTGADKPIQVVCKLHGEFTINAKGFATRGHGCTKCSNERKTLRSYKPLQFYKTKFDVIHKGKYEYSYESDKLNTDSQVSIKCNFCGYTFMQRVAAHLSGQGCPECAKKARGFISKEQAEQRLLEACGDRYEYDFTDYIKASSNIKVRCVKHNKVFYKDYYNLIKNKHSCPICKKEGYKEFRKILPQKEVIKSFVKKHGDLYDYSKVDYKGGTQRVTVTCKVHGDFNITPTLHKGGQGCPKCAGLIIDTENFINKAKEVHGDQFDYTEASYEGSHIKTPVTCTSCEHTYEVAPYSHLTGVGCPKCSAKMVSKRELEIGNYIESLSDTTLLRNVRGIIGRKELDVYLPEYNLAIEYNGVYWHSSNSKDKDVETSKKHIHKTEACEALGIQLLHISESEWVDPVKQSIWKSLIKNKLGKSERVYARKCTIQEVDNVEARKFCQENHLQGNAHSSTQLGLYFNEQLLMLTTFSKSRFSEEDYELLRMCTLKGFTVVGGASKLIKAFKRSKEANTTLVSYANRRWSIGNVYQSTGFTFKHYSKPCYFYYLGRATNKELYHRSKFQKHKLSKLLDIFDSSLSEVDNMYANGYRRIWDSGNIVYTL